jgi:hypothetical protein
MEIVDENLPEQIVMPNASPTNISSFNDHQKLALIKQFAPLVKFHRSEKFFPTSVDNLLKGASLKQKTEENGKKVIKTLMPLIQTEEDRDKLAEFSQNNRGTFIDFRKDKKFKYGDTLRAFPENPYTSSPYESPAPCYANLLEKEDGGIVIFYAFVYSYNGPTVGPDTPKGGIGYHNGDIEYIYVHLKKTQKSLNKPFNVNNYTLDRVFFSHHGGRSHGYFKEAKDLEVVSDESGKKTHPVVYAGKYGHASHFSGAPFLRLKTFDWTSNTGPVWRCWKYMIDVGDPTKPRKGWGWVKFSGRWGNGGPEDFEWRIQDKQLHSATELNVQIVNGKALVNEQNGKKLKKGLFTLKKKILTRAEKICWMIDDPNMSQSSISFDIYQKKRLSKDRLVYKNISLVSNQLFCVPLPDEKNNLYIGNLRTSKGSEIPNNFKIKVFSQEY